MPAKSSVGRRSFLRNAASNLGELSIPKRRVTRLLRTLITAVTLIRSAAGQSGAAQQRAIFDQFMSEGDRALSGGRCADAKRSYSAAVDAAKTGSDAAALPRALNAVAVIYHMEGDYDKAESLCREALAIGEEKLDKDSPVLADALNTLASVYLHVRRFGDAERCLRRGISIRENRYTGRSPDRISDYTLLAIALSARHRYKEARQTCEYALTLCSPNESGCQVSLAGADMTLGKLYCIAKRYGEAEEADRRALAIMEKAAGPANAMLLSPLASLASLYVGMRRYGEAETASRRALALAEAELQSADSTAEATLALAQAMEGQGRADQAELYFQRTIAIHSRTRGFASVEYALSLQQYALFLRKTKRSPEARKLEMQAHSILMLSEQKVDVAELSRGK
jgi:tetratricopeptide (TPR) repeat protein